MMELTVRRPNIQRQDMAWAEEDRASCMQTFAGTSIAEYLVRRQAGQPCELWEINGGVDNDGTTVLWVPAESVARVSRVGLPPTWYYSPLGRDTTLEGLADRDTYNHYPFAFWSELRYYRPWSAVCATCERLLTADDWELAIIVSDGGMEEPKCDVCFQEDLAALPPLSRVE
jgi:hypothetical protein